MEPALALVSEHVRLHLSFLAEWFATQLAWMASLVVVQRYVRVEDAELRERLVAKVAPAKIVYNASI